jgi:thioredoxin-related protein
MENTTCNHCGSYGMILNIHGCYHCSVCKCVIFQEQDVQEQDFFDEDYCDIEYVSRVTFHTDNNRYAMGFAAGM